MTNGGPRPSVPLKRRSNSKDAHLSSTTTNDSGLTGLESREPVASAEAEAEEEGEKKEGHGESGGTGRSAATT